MDQNNSCKLPETKSEVTTVEYYLASAPGLAAPDVGPDANTYEEMLNDAINLKRYYKQVMSFIKLGTYKDLFKDPNMSNIPLALLILRNHSPLETLVIHLFLELKIYYLCLFRYLVDLI